MPIHSSIWADLIPIFVPGTISSLLQKFIFWPVKSLVFWEQVTSPYILSITSETLQIWPAGIGTSCDLWERTVLSELRDSLLTLGNFEWRLLPESWIWASWVKEKVKPENLFAPQMVMPPGVTNRKLPFLYFVGKHGPLRERKANPVFTRQICFFGNHTQFKGRGLKNNRKFCGWHCCLSDQMLSCASCRVLKGAR